MRAVPVLAIAALAATGTAAASTVSISPVRLELSSAKSTAVLVVRGQDDAPVVLQVRPVAWSQRSGEDQLDDTQEILVSPPLFTLAPRGEQILRVALRRSPDPSRELDYRLVFDEVLPAKPAGFTGLRVALRITLPVFVAAQTRTAPELTWRHGWLADGSLRLEAQNHGSAHIQIRDLDVQITDRPQTTLHTDSARYLLPGARAKWQLRTSAGALRPGKLLVHGHSDAGDFTVSSDSEPDT
jgi:fimbrial chaperone protein